MFSGHLTSDGRLITTPFESMVSFSRCLWTKQIPRSNVILEAALCSAKGLLEGSLYNLLTGQKDEGENSFFVNFKMILATI